MAKLQSVKTSIALDRDTMRVLKRESIRQRTTLSGLIRMIGLKIERGEIVL